MCALLSMLMNMKVDSGAWRAHSIDIGDVSMHHRWLIKCSKACAQCGSLILRADLHGCIALDACMHLMNA
jgi:hypothetical protein